MTLLKPRPVPSPLARPRPAKPQPLPPRQGMRLTIDEFFDLPETDDRRKMELDEGVLHIMVKPGFDHQFILGQLLMYLDSYLESFEEPPADVIHDFITMLSPERRILLAPDISLILWKRRNDIREYWLDGPPDIAIEILSTNRQRDLTRKRRLYAEAGVAEYWIFDPRRDNATILELPGLELPDGQYRERAVLTAADTLTTPLLPGLDIPLSGLFDNRRRPTAARR